MLCRRLQQSSLIAVSINIKELFDATRVNIESIGVKKGTHKKIYPEKTRRNKEMQQQKKKSADPIISSFPFPSSRISFTFFFFPLLCVFWRERERELRLFLIS